MDEKKKCLWCNKELDDGFFCKGGGNTIGISNTGEKNMTKSFCYNDFLGMLKTSKEQELGFIKVEQTYLLWSNSIKDWYKQLTFVEDTFNKVEE